MKRIVSITLLCLLSFSSASHAEQILFRNIEWTSSPFIFENRLAEDKIVPNPSNYSLSTDYTFINYELRSSYALEKPWKSNSFPFFTRYIKNPPCKVAGYSLLAISANFIPSFDEQGILHTDIESAHLFNATYVIQDFSNGKPQSSSEAFIDLKSKLSGLYGLCLPSDETDTSFAFWRGDDATCVALHLYTSKYGDTIQIQYYSGVAINEAQAILTAYTERFSADNDGL